MFLKFSKKTYLHRVKSKYFISNLKARYQINLSLFIFFARHYRTGFSRRDFLCLSKNSGVSSTILNTLQNEKFFVTANQIQNHQLLDEVVIQKQGYNCIQPVKISKNGRVYLVRKSKKKWIFKFQETKNPLHFIWESKLAFSPKVYEYEYSRTSRWYVQAFVNGSTLDQGTKKFCNSMNLIIKKIKNVETELRENDIIHGDIHPGNFLIKNKHLYLVDFDNSFLMKNLQRTKRFIKPTGLNGYVHPDIQKGTRFPDFETQSYSFKKVIRYLQQA